MTLYAICYTPSSLQYTLYVRMYAFTSTEEKVFPLSDRAPGVAVKYLTNTFILFLITCKDYYLHLSFYQIPITRELYKDSYFPRWQPYSSQAAVFPSYAFPKCQNIPSFQVWRLQMPS